MGGEHGDYNERGEYVLPGVGGQEALRALIPHIHWQGGMRGIHNCDFRKCRIEPCPMLRAFLDAPSDPASVLSRLLECDREGTVRAWEALLLAAILAGGMDAALEQIKVSPACARRAVRVVCRSLLEAPKEGEG